MQRLETNISTINPGQHFVYVTKFNLLCFGDNARSRVTRQGKLMAIKWCTYINIINDLYSVFSNGVHASTYVLYTSTSISYFVLTNDMLLHNDGKNLPYGNTKETQIRIMDEISNGLLYCPCHNLFESMYHYVF